LKRRECRSQLPYQYTDDEYLDQLPEGGVEKRSRPTAITVLKNINVYRLSDEAGIYFMNKLEIFSSAARSGIFRVIIVFIDL
jgi:hypothetical protein